MLIAGISASPKKNGHNDRIIKNALEEFEKRGYETEFIGLSEKKVSPCVSCGKCKEQKDCFQYDSGNEINSILEKADAIIISTPVYFGSMTGQLKCLFDRTVALRRNGFLLKGKICAAIAVGGSRNGGQELAIKDIHAWALIHGMVIVGDDNHFGGTVKAYEEDSFGQETIDGTISAVDNLLKRLDKGFHQQ